jgi:hypothetical protein
MQLAEDKHRRDGQRREEQRKHAYDVPMKEMIEEKDKLDIDRSENKPSQKDLLGEEYEYDEEYFNIQEKSGRNKRLIIAIRIDKIPFENQSDRKYLSVYTRVNKFVKSKSSV